MYIPTNVTSISIAIWKLIIFAADRRIIVATRPINEMTMPATTFSVLFLGIGYAGYDLLPRHSRETLEKFIDALTAFQIID
jgi:hypothetical protein